MTQASKSAFNFAKSATAGRIANTAYAGLTLNEACQILNVRPLQAGKTDMTAVMGRFKRLYDLNEPARGGSLYLQSKVLRARERIEHEVREKEDKAEREKELERGWKPKLYR